MKVSDLIKELEEYDKESNVTFNVCLPDGYTECCGCDREVKYDGEYFCTDYYSIDESSKLPNTVIITIEE